MILIRIKATDLCTFHSWRSNITDLCFQKCLVINDIELRTFLLNGHFRPPSPPHTDTHSCSRTHAHTHTHMRARAHTHTHSHTRACTHTGAQSHHHYYNYTHTHTHTHTTTITTNIHARTHTLLLSLLLLLLQLHTHTHVLTTLYFFTIVWRPLDIEDYPTVCVCVYAWV